MNLIPYFVCCLCCLPVRGWDGGGGGGGGGGGVRKSAPKINTKTIES